MKFDGRFTSKKYIKRETSKAYVGQECAEIRYTAARSLDTEEVGHGFKNLLGVRKTELYILRNRCLGDVNIHVTVGLYCSKHDVYADSPPKI